MQLPAHLQNRQSRALAQTTRTGLASKAPPSISIAGNAFTLIDENGIEKPVPTPYLDCVIIDATAIVSRVFWGLEGNYGSYIKAYDTKAQAFLPPVCYSDNGVGASNMAASPQSTNCKGCQWSVWGSAISRMDQQPIPACSATKKVAVYVPGIRFPFVLRVPIMSHKALDAYMGNFVGQNFDVDALYTRVSFVHGEVGKLAFAPSFQADPRLMWVTPEDATAIDEILKKKATDILVGRDDVVWSGQGGHGQLAGPGGQPALAPPPASAPPALPAGTAPPFGAVAPSPAAPVAPPSFGQPPQATGPAPTAAPPAEPRRRGGGRPRKNQEQPAPQQGTGSPPFGAPAAGQSAAPPSAPPSSPVGFAPSASPTNPFAQPEANAGERQAPFGIAPGAPPPADLGNELQRAFGLPTGS